MLPSTFTGNTTPTGEQLDANFAALGALTPIPCTIAGTNTITGTPLANTPTIAAYANYMQFTGIASATNTGPVVWQVGGLASLSVYKDTSAGPVLLTGGEIVQNTKIILMYDSSLNGFHLISPPSLATRNHVTTASITLGAITPQNGSTATVLLGGTSIGDIITLGFPSLVSVGLVWEGYVNNAGTVTLIAFNAASVTITPTPGTYRIRSEGYT